VTGLCLGLAQWPVLRRHIRMPGLWMVATVLGWASAYLAGAILDPAGIALRTIDVLMLFRDGAIIGIWTGLALVLLWKRPKEQATL